MHLDGRQKGQHPIQSIQPNSSRPYGPQHPLVETVCLWIHMTAQSRHPHPIPPLNHRYTRFCTALISQTAIRTAQTVKFADRCGVGFVDRLKRGPRRGAQPSQKARHPPGLIFHHQRSLVPSRSDSR